MTPELEALIEQARNHVMTDEEVFEQRVSFVYGQQDYDSPNPLSKDEVRQALRNPHKFWKERLAVFPPPPETAP